jgi:signal transduction histidine kinase
MPSLRSLPPPATSFATWEEMKAYVELDDVCIERLAKLRPHVEARAVPIIDHFYEQVLRFPNASSVLESPAQVERLKQTLRTFIVEMLSGPYGQDYFNKRRRIGLVHVRVGLPEHFVFVAMSRLRSDICNVAAECLPPEELIATCNAVARITDLELAVMSSTYLEAHEAHQLRTLQDLIIQNLPVTVLCLDDVGQVTSATRPSTRLFGMDSAHGRHYEDFIPAELIERSDLPSHLGRALATGHEITIPRVRMGERTDERQFRITLVPLDHELARLLLHIEELTDVVQAEQRLQQSEALARIGSLAAHLAHEIRNPLAAISATLQVIVGSLPVDDRRKVILDKVRGQVHRLDRLVTDLLGYARPARADVTEVRLGPVVREAIAQAGVPVEIEVDDQTTVIADPQYLQQVVVNLVQNSRDALESAGLGTAGTIGLRQSGPTRFDIYDRGPGISKEVAGRLFEPFVTSKVKGTGLGLAISRKLIRSMGGELELVPVDVGASFRITLRAPMPKD